jgi:hypothetical protein
VNSAPRDIPVIFSAAMVRAENEGLKTNTRRLLYSERRVTGDRIPGNATALFPYPPPRLAAAKIAGAMEAVVRPRRPECADGLDMESILIAEAERA